MRVGAVYPQIELGGDPAAARRFAVAVEDLGFDHLSAYDHVLGASHEDRHPELTGPYTEHDPFHDPLTMFAHVAALTQRIELVSSVLVLPQRQTALVARQAADVALFSGGRLRLGIGTGWNHVEYEALGVPFAGRGDRVEEQVEVLRRLWSEPLVDFAGEFHRVNRAGVLPRPATPIPIWMGGFGPRPMARAARVADGFIFAGSRVVLDQLEATREQVRQAGRDVASFGTELNFGAPTPEAVLTRLVEWEAAGGSHAAVVTMYRGFDSVDAHLDFLARVRDLWANR